VNRFDEDPPADERAEREVERLLAAAGPRPRLDEAELEAAREAARAAFRVAAGEAPRERPRAPAPPAAPRAARRAARWALPLAAALTLALGALLWRELSRPPAPSPAPGAAVAVVERIDGAGAVRAPGTDAAAAPRPLAPGQRLEAGSVVTTGGAVRLALRLAGGASLRVDAGSELELAADERIALARGRIYLDSDPAAGGRAPAVATPHGEWVDLGTQYELALDPASGSARLRVREGTVELRDGRTLRAAAGEELAVGRDGRTARAAIAPSSPEWAWAVESVPLPAIEGWTLARFLAWYARESGLAVAYADAAAAERAASVTVHGSVRNLTPAAAAEAVLASAGCRFAVAGERIVVSAVR
jgi:hypothetical protein